MRMDNVMVGWLVWQSWCGDMGTLCVPPSSLPASWQHTQHSKFNSVQLWASGEVFAGTSSEQMRQLRSLSLQHYMLWGGGRINPYSKLAGASPSIYLGNLAGVVHPLCTCGCLCRALHDVSLCALSLAWCLFPAGLVQAPHAWDPAASALPHAHLASPACHPLQPRKTSAK